MFNNYFTLSVSGVGRLFAVGDSSLLNQPMVSVAGSRQIDSSSTQWLDNIIGQISNHCVVSGLALGSDRVAHESALNHGLPTIAVLPSGFNHITPRSHIRLAHRIVNSGGLLLSAYHPDTYVKKDQYIARNKIIAQLGKLLIIPQCNVKSGTMHTVRFAHQLNKPIVVQSAGYSGNSFIINNLGGLAK